MTIWLVVRVLFCYFLQELKVHVSRKFGRENYKDANDVNKVCNKDDEGDNVGAMFQGESKTIDEEIILPLAQS